MMRKTVILLLSVLLCLVLIGCGKTVAGMQKNLSDAGYSVTERSEERLAEMSKSMKTDQKTTGGLVSGFFASKQSDSLSVTVLEFENKDDMTLLYKSLKKELMADEEIDFSGNLLVYGSKEAVRTALG